jgi:hypothetical protein
MDSSHHRRWCQIGPDRCSGTPEGAGHGSAWQTVMRPMPFILDFRLYSSVCGPCALPGRVRPGPAVFEDLQEPRCHFIVLRFLPSLAPRSNTAVPNNIFLFGSRDAPDPMACPADCSALISKAKSPFLSNLANGQERYE